jgi:hypothetical protein
MKSPFPGMDPYIEACGLWEDFHDDLIAEIKRVLAREVPKGYVVRTRSRSYVVLAQAEEKSERPSVPDVSVTSTRGASPPPPAEGGLPLPRLPATSSPSPCAPSSRRSTRRSSSTSTS